MKPFMVWHDIKLFLYNVTLPLTPPFMLKKYLKSWHLFWPHIFFSPANFFLPHIFWPHRQIRLKTGSLKKWGIASKIESCHNFYSCLIGYMEPFMVWHHIELFFFNVTIPLTPPFMLKKYLQILASVLAPHIFFALQIFCCPTVKNESQASSITHLSQARAS